MSIASTQLNIRQPQCNYWPAVPTNNLFSAAVFFTRHFFGILQFVHAALLRLLFQQLPAGYQLRCTALSPQSNSAGNKSASTNLPLRLWAATIRLFCNLSQRLPSPKALPPTIATTCPHSYDARENSPHHHSPARQNAPTKNYTYDYDGHRLNYDAPHDLRRQPRSTAGKPYLSPLHDMSQYRAYFVPSGVDPWGLHEDTFRGKIALHKYGVTSFTGLVHGPRLELSNSNLTGTIVPVGQDVEYNVAELLDANKKDFQALGLTIGVDIEIDSKHDCEECYWSQLTQGDNGQVVYDGGNKRYPFQEVEKGFTSLEDHPGLFFGLGFQDFVDLYERDQGAARPGANPLNPVFHFPQAEIDKFWQATLQNNLKKKTSYESAFFTQLICIIDGKEEKVGQWRWGVVVDFKNGRAVSQFWGEPAWKNNEN